VLSFTSCTFGSGTLLCQINGHGQLEVQGLSTSGRGGSADLADLTFTAAATASVGATTSLRPLIGLFKDPEATPICASGLGSVTPPACAVGDQPVATAGTLTIGEVGDVNGDGLVDATDALCVLRLVASLPSTGGCPIPVHGNPDVNHDAATDTGDASGADATDALCILRHVAFLGATGACPLFGAQTAGRAAAAAGSKPTAPAGSAASGASAQVRLSSSSLSIARGEQATVSVESAATGAGLGSWTVDLKYDPKTVKPVRCEALAGAVCNLSYAAGVVRVTGVSTAGLAGSQTLATLTFEGLGRGRSQSPLTVIPVTLTDPSGARLGAGASPSQPQGTGANRR